MVRLLQLIKNELYELVCFLRVQSKEEVDCVAFSADCSSREMSSSELLSGCSAS